MYDMGHIARTQVPGIKEKTKKPTMSLASCLEHLVPSLFSLHDKRKFYDCETHAKEITYDLIHAACGKNNIGMFTKDAYELLQLLDEGKHTLIHTTHPLSNCCLPLGEFVVYFPWSPSSSLSTCHTAPVGGYSESMMDDLVGHDGFSLGYRHPLRKRKKVTVP